MIQQIKMVGIIALIGGLALFGTLRLLATDLPAIPAQQANLKINEFMADNQFTLEDPDEPGEYPDWIELYNPGTEPVSLDNLYWTDNPGRPTRFAITTGLVISPGGFMLFYADNDPRQGPRHLNFALNRESGFIGLYSDITDSMIDFREYGPQTTDVSEGFQFDGSGEWRTFIHATPGRTNTLLPPNISQVQQTPAQPPADAPVSITAVITDERALASATLYYSITGGSLLTLPMTVVGENLLQTTIPPQPVDTVVRYYLVAQDIDGLITRAPAGAPLLVYAYKAGFLPPLIYINEIMADNESTLRNPDLPDDYPDWIELYNPGVNPVSLNGLFLTDNIEDPDQYAIPDGLTIPAGGYLLFYADNAPGWGPQHTNFRLSRDGEYVGLYGGGGNVLIDGYTFGPQEADVSTGRYPDGGPTWANSACATPGSTNKACVPAAFLPVISAR